MHDSWRINGLGSVNNVSRDIRILRRICIGNHVQFETNLLMDETDCSPMRTPGKIFDKMNCHSLNFSSIRVRIVYIFTTFSFLSRFSEMWRYLHFS